jgi:hypothetical protein
MKKHYNNENPFKRKRLRVLIFLVNTLSFFVFHEPLPLVETEVSDLNYIMSQYCLSRQSHFFMKHETMV